MNNNISTLILIPIISLAVMSCGKQSSNNNQSTVASFEEDQPIEGEYKAFLRPLNTSVSGYIPSGAAEFKINDEKFNVKTYLDDDSPIGHIQHVYAGDKCPTLADDLNGDGLIDIQEAMRITGKSLIPLDNDLSSQKAGYGLFPTGKGFTYMKSIKLDVLLTDLTLPGEDEKFAKLNKNKNLNLAGRVVMIHGTADKSRVPLSVATLDDQPNNATIPIACGIIKRVK
jgi:hypothetical protein